ncbi:hypothetical protein SAMN02745121_06417 [Nannocystis exedens]|uniref:Uncharacterized protein n=1 Tax=Nannocystis exedens TaxID=54 RepID=A0A1I2F2Q4_9BACT|nr:hypothetical protein NAEX_02632 [Nannocystis exedens]SFE99107.1 hypothetical protein SAMN02745121_06417 [Nannocystis exedens]
MGICEIPDSFAAMVELARIYEARHRHPAESNRVVAQGALAAMLRLLPQWTAVGRSPCMPCSIRRCAALAACPKPRARWPGPSPASARRAAASGHSRAAEHGDRLERHECRADAARLLRGVLSYQTCWMRHPGHGPLVPRLS